MKPSALFLTNGGHIRLPGNQACFDDLLGSTAGLSLTQSANNAHLNAADLARFDIVIDYGGDTPREPTDAQLDALVSAVEGGLPFVGLHAASLPFRSQLPQVQRALRQKPGAWLSAPGSSAFLSPSRRRFFDMLGSAFITHPPVKTITVRIADQTHPITHGIDDFDIEDERYELGGDWARHHVLASAEGHPLLYTSRWGRGKVHYNALGHTHRALDNPHYRRLLVQGIAWALNGSKP